MRIYRRGEGPGQWREVGCERALQGEVNKDDELK